MPTRIPHHTVAVHRDGKTVRPPLGKPFDFTADEVTEIMAANRDALRRPIMEAMPSRVADTVAVSAQAKPSAKAAPAKQGKPAKASAAADAGDEDDDSL